MNVETKDVERAVSRIIHSSVEDGCQEVSTTTSIEVLDRARERETNCWNRRTLIDAIDRRKRKLERAEAKQ